MAVTQPANSVLQPFRAKYDECVFRLLQRRSSKDHLKHADVQYAAKGHVPYLMTRDPETLSDETHRKYGEGVRRTTCEES